MGYDKAIEVLIDSLKNMDFENFRARPKIWDKNLYTREVDAKFVLNVSENVMRTIFTNPGMPMIISLTFSSMMDGISNILLDGIVNIISVHKDEYHV